MRLRLIALSLAGILAAAPAAAGSVFWLKPADLPLGTYLPPDPGANAKGQSVTLASVGAAVNPPGTVFKGKSLTFTAQPPGIYDYRAVQMTSAPFVLTQWGSILAAWSSFCADKAARIEFHLMFGHFNDMAAFVMHDGILATLDANGKEKPFGTYKLKPDAPGIVKAPPLPVSVLMNTDMKSRTARVTVIQDGVLVHSGYLPFPTKAAIPATPEYVTLQTLFPGKGTVVLISDGPAINANFKK